MYEEKGKMQGVERGGGTRGLGDFRKGKVVDGGEGANLKKIKDGWEHEFIPITASKGRNTMARFFRLG